METSINDQSGGTAAESTKINSKQEPDTNIEMTELTEIKDEPIMLKQAGTLFACAASSLKNNIKSQKLYATQENKRAPYLVLPSNAEAFLRATPGIVSMFHPAGKKPAATGTTYPPTASKPGDKPHDTATIPPMQSVVASAAQTYQPAGAAASREGQACQNQETVVAPRDSPEAQTGSSKRRRRRRRGKGDGFKLSVASNIQPPVLKALAGTTPQERLRITAFLTELLGLVASA